jgi:flavin-binding protein dodecin
MTKKDKGSSVYKVIELVGTSHTSFADAAQSAVVTASKTIKDIRVAEVTKLDLKVDKGGKMVFRAKLKLSFKYHQIA